MIPFAKIIRISTEELLFDPDAESKMVEHACFRTNPPCRVTGICDCGDGLVLLALEQTTSAVPAHYRFAPLPDSSLDGVSAELKHRQILGMSFLGSFQTPDEKHPLWALYARFPE